MSGEHLEIRIGVSEKKLALYREVWESLAQTREKKVKGAYVIK